MIKRKHKGGGLSVATTIVLIIFVIVVSLCATNLYDIHNRKDSLLKEKQKLEAQKQALIERNEEILQRQTATGNTQYIENIARTQLDMVYPGEIIFVTGS